MDAHVDDRARDEVFAIGGIFDPLAASRLCVRLAELPPGTSVVLDFSRVLEVSDLALAVLAVAIAAPRRPRVVLRGLRHHQERMLQYLGIDEGVLDRLGRHPSPALAGQA